MPANNTRQVRLAQEWEMLQALNRESDHVRVQPIDVLPGRSPEKYKVTFQCRGITGIEASRKPIYGTHHEVEIYCHADFPTYAPWLKWLTPIWHPNIEHAGDRRVCINKAEWLGGMALEDLCQQMFEMVQYKNYHAELSPPYPLDSEAATWVRDYAERNGIVDKKRGIFVDNVPFQKPTASERVSRIRIVTAKPENAGGSRVKFHRPTQSASDPKPRVILEAGASSISCPGCGDNLPPNSKFCGRCGSSIESAPRRIAHGD